MFRLPSLFIVLRCWVLWSLSVFKLDLPLWLLYFTRQAREWLHGTEPPEGMQTVFYAIQGCLFCLNLKYAPIRTETTCRPPNTHTHTSLRNLASKLWSLHVDTTRYPHTYPHIPIEADLHLKRTAWWGTHHPRVWWVFLGGGEVGGWVWVCARTFLPRKVTMITARKQCSVSLECQGSP